MSKKLDVKINMLDVKINIYDNIKEFELESAYDILYADSFLKYDPKERTFSYYCKKCNMYEKDISFKNVVAFISDHEELFSVNNYFYFFKCKRNM